MIKTQFEFRPGWTLIHSIEDQVGLELVLKLLTSTAKMMEYYFDMSFPKKLEIIIDQNLPLPINIYDMPRIMLACEPIYWSQLIYQFTHEYCHRLIDSPYPPIGPLWFEEAICECSSRFFLQKIGKTNLHSKPLKKYQNEFILYSKERSNSDFEIPWNLKQGLINENIIDKLTEEISKNERPHINFVSTNMMPIFDVHPDLWSSVQYLRYFRNDNSIQESIDKWQVENSNVAEILDLFLPNQKF